jgi:hypothetical protein
VRRREQDLLRRRPGRQGTPISQLTNQPTD